jgi:phosphoketolase
MQLHSLCPETTTAVFMLGEHLPKLRIRMANLVDQMKRWPPIERAHWIFGLDLDWLFTRQMPGLRKRQWASTRE